MSHASEWAGKWAALVIPAREEAPRIRFESLQDGGATYSVVAYVSCLEATGEPVLGFGASITDHPVALRASNALLLARWILDTFGDGTDSVSLAS